VVNPTFILGPTLTTQARSSLQLTKAMLDGTMPVVRRQRFGVADVRDVADLHIRAMATPEAAGKRFLALADGPTISFLEMAQILRERLGPLAERVPTEEAPGPEPPRLIIHNDRAKQELGWRPRPAETTIVETAESLRDLGLLAGGVGSTAVQLARAWGAGRVIAVASNDEKRNLALSLGADAVVDSGSSDLTEELIAANDGHGVDVVLEMTGGDVFRAALESLGHFGRLVHYGAASRTMAPPVEPRELMANCTAIVGFWLMQCNRKMLQESLDDLWAMAARGELRPLIGELYPLSDARRAHEDLRARGTVGKLALDPAR
jgi:hypothetical protein